MLARLTVANVANNAQIVMEVAGLIQTVKTGWDQIVDTR
jgi:flagellin-specific chaperone FliS